MVSVTNVLVVVLVVAGIGFFAFAFIGPQNSNKEVTVNAGAVLENTQQNFEKFALAELSDKCATPPGYSEEDWKTHMGHHPDRYAECL